MIGRRWACLLTFLVVVAAAATAHAAGHAHHGTNAASTVAAAPVAPSAVARGDRAGCSVTTVETPAPCAHGHDEGCDCTAVCTAALLPPAVAPRGIAGRPPIGPAAEADARPHTRAPPLPPPRA